MIALLKPKNNRVYRYVLVIIDNFNKFGWTLPLENKYSQSITDSISKNNKSSNRKSNLLETVDGKEYVIKSFNEFWDNNDIKRYSRHTDKGAVFAEKFNRTVRIFSKKLVFEKGNANGVKILPSVMKKHNNTIHSSTKMKSNEKSNVIEVYVNLQERRDRQKPKFKL